MFQVLDYIYFYLDFKIFFPLMVCKLEIMLTWDY